MDISYILYMIELRETKSYCITLLVGCPSSVSQPTANLSSLPQSVQPMTIQTTLQGLTTTSSILATTASLPAQTITSHVHQVPVSVFDWHLNEPDLHIQNKCAILIFCVLWNQKRHRIFWMCVFSGAATASVHQGRVSAADHTEAWPLHGHYCGHSHIPGHHHHPSTEHFTAGGRIVCSSVLTSYSALWGEGGGSNKILLCII